MSPDPEILPAVVEAPAVPAPRTLHQEELAHEIFIWDEANPRSVLNIVKHPPLFKKQCLDAKHEHPELFEMDEARLYEKLKEMSATPKAVDNRLRLKFWFEYDYAQQYVEDLRLQRVTAGVMETNWFVKGYLDHATKVAWLLCPPQNYMVKANEALEFSLEQMRTILDEAHSFPAPGPGQLATFNLPLAKLKFEIFKALDMRVKGAPTQRNMHLHAHTGSKAVAAQIAGQAMAGSVEDMKKRLEYLKGQEVLMKNGGMLGIEPPKETE